MVNFSKRKRKRSDSVLCQKPLHPQKIQKATWQHIHTTKTSITQKATWQHKYTTKNFDYTTNVDRLRTVTWRNVSHLTGVVKLVYGNPRLLSNSQYATSRTTPISKFGNTWPPEINATSPSIWQVWQGVFSLLEGLSRMPNWYSWREKISVFKIESNCSFVGEFIPFCFALLLQFWGIIFQIQNGEYISVEISFCIFDQGTIS